MGEFIKPDTFYSMDIGLEKQLLINAKYDRIDHWKPVGQFVLKAYDDDMGLVVLMITEDFAEHLRDEVGLPVVDRDTIFESEYAQWSKNQVASVDKELDDLE